MDSSELRRSLASGAPEIFTLEGTDAPAAYDNEGYAILGYRVANNSICEEWTGSTASLPSS